MSSPRTETVYGVHTVCALLARHPERVQRVYLQRARADERARRVERLAAEAARPLERVEASWLQARLGPVAHQGVAALVEALTPWREEQLLAAVGATVGPLLLALDGVQDPHNLGACLRTADACGALAVIVPRDRSAPLNATARKVAAGAAEATAVAMVTNLARTLALLQDAGLWIVGAEAGAAREAREVDLSGGRVLVLGSEGTGLRTLTRRQCDWLVRLPDLGAVGSLNVSVAAGMLLYEALRQRAEAVHGGAVEAARGGNTPAQGGPGGAR